MNLPVDPDRVALHHRALEIARDRRCDYLEAALLAESETTSVHAPRGYSIDQTRLDLFCEARRLQSTSDLTFVDAVLSCEAARAAHARMIPEGIERFRAGSAMCVCTDARRSRRAAWNSTRGKPRPRRSAA